MRSWSCQVSARSPPIWCCLSDSGERRSHLDSYTKTILEVLYGVEPDETTMTAFVDKQFGRWKHYAMLLLTTDTDRWAPSLGTDFPIKSDASYRAPNG